LLLFYQEVIGYPEAISPRGAGRKRQFMERWGDFRVACWAVEAQETQNVDEGSPLGILVQGMRQLQQMYMEKKGGVDNEVLKGAELPALPELSGDTGVEFSDWLYVAEQTIGSMSDSASTWYEKTLACVREAYHRYQVATPLERLSIGPRQAPELLEPRWIRLDRKVMTLVLAAMPKMVREDAVTHRVSSVAAVLYRFHILYSPGGIAERTTVLKQLEGVGAGDNVVDVITALRKWKRHLSRSQEMHLSVPDASILLRGLDTICASCVQKHSEMSFRLSLARNELQLQSRPTQETVMKFYDHLMAEMQQALPAKWNQRGAPGTGETPKIKAIGAGTGEASTTTSPTASPSRSSQRGSAASTPCKFFLSDAGCKRGQACKYQHEFQSRDEKRSRCWYCGSKQHRQNECPAKEPRRPKDSPASSTSSARPQSTPTVAAVQPVIEPKASMPLVAGTISSVPTTAMSGDAMGVTESLGTTTNAAVQGPEFQAFMKEVNTMLQRMTRLNSLKIAESLDPEVSKLEATMAKFNEKTETYALLDSGATHPFKPFTEQDFTEMVQVQLADGQTVDLQQNRAGTLMPVKSAGSKDNPVTTIVPLGTLVQELNCAVSWDRHGLRVQHPEHGELTTHVVGSCPFIGETKALQLIEEIEARKLEQLKVNTVETQLRVMGMEAETSFEPSLMEYRRSGKRTDGLKALMSSDSVFHHIIESQRCALVQDIDLTDAAGMKYLKALPIKRALRRRLLSARWIVNMCSGPDEHPDLKALETDGLVLLELDLFKSKAFNLRDHGPAYRVLLWAAMRGQLEGILGSPPRGEGEGELVLKQLFLWWIGKVASEAMEKRDPYFVMTMPVNSASRIWRPHGQWRNGKLKPEGDSFNGPMTLDAVWFKEYIVGEGWVILKRLYQKVVQNQQMIQIPVVLYQKVFQNQQMIQIPVVLYQKVVQNQQMIQIPVVLYQKVFQNQQMIQIPVVLYQKVSGEDPIPQVGDLERDEMDALNAQYKELVAEVGDTMDYQVLRYAVPMRSRRASEVNARVRQMYLQVKADGLEVFRLHSDRATELCNRRLREWLLERGVLATTGEAQTPQQNGRAEATVKFVKSEARLLMTTARLPKSTWPLAMMYATAQQRQRALGKPGELPGFGTPVHVRTKIYGQSGKYDVENKWAQGVYVGPSEDVQHGHVVRFPDATFVTSLHLKHNLVDADELVDLVPREIEIPLPERRIRGKKRLHRLLVDHPLSVEEELAETEAKKLIRGGDWSVEGILKLFDYLKAIKPKQTSGRAATGTGCSWYTGMFVHGGVAGLRGTTTRMKWSTKYLVEAAKLITESDDFTALGLLEDMDNGCHKDSHNEIDSTNVVTLLQAPEEGGDLWLEHEDLDPKYAEWKLVAKKLWKKGFTHRLEVGKPFRAMDSPEAETLDDALLTLTESQNQLLEDLQERSERLRMMIEEEEILAEECRRAGQQVDDEVDNVRAYLEDMMDEVTQLKAAGGKASSEACLKAAMVQEEPDYERLLQELDGDLEVVHTVPLQQVRAALDQWREALEKEVTQLLDGTLRPMPIARAKQMEAQGLLKLVQSKGVFTLKPPQVKGKKVRRKFRLVLCGNQVDRDDETFSLYASGLSADTVRLALAYASHKRWYGGTSDVTGRTIVLKQSSADSEIWLAFDEDDVLRPVIEAIHAWIQEAWPCSELEWADGPTGTRYLGMEIQQRPDFAFELSQEGYIRELLRSYGMEDALSTKLPCPREWLAGDDSEEENYTIAELKQGQKAVGEQLWLMMRCRPDLQFPVAYMASKVSKCPNRVVQIAKRLLAYLKTTASMKMVIGNKADNECQQTTPELVAWSDASFSPSGEKSFGASVVTVNGYPVAWKASKQAFVTLSVMEAELLEASTATTLLENIGCLLDELAGLYVPRRLLVDNASAVAMIAGGPGSWRTRHLKVRSAKIREQVENLELIVEHVGGNGQLADLATKMHGKVRLWELLSLWGFRGLPDEAIQALHTKSLYLTCLIWAMMMQPVTANDSTNTRIQMAGVDELLLVTVLVCFTAVTVWELIKYGTKWVLKACRESPKQRRLRKLREAAKAAAEEEVDRAVLARSGETTPPPEPHPTARPSRVISSPEPMYPTGAAFERMAHDAFYKTDSNRSKLHTDPQCHGLRNAGPVFKLEYCVYCSKNEPIYVKRTEFLGQGGVWNLWSVYVFLSIKDCDKYQSVPLMRIKYLTEKFLAQSTLRYTVLRISGLMQPLISQYAVCVLDDQKVWGDDGSMPGIAYVDSQDVARWTASAMVKERTVGQTLTLTGPKVWSTNEVIKLCEKLSGREADINTVSNAQMQATMSAASFFDWSIDVAERLRFVEVNQLGSAGTPMKMTDTDYQLLGMDPSATRGLDEYIGEYYRRVFKKLMKGKYEPEEGEVEREKAEAAEKLNMALATDTSDVLPAGQTEEQEVQIGEQRDTAERLQKYFEDKILTEMEDDKNAWFGLTPLAELFNGRAAMMGFSLGLFTEWATEVNVANQIDLMISIFSPQGN
ncbi:HCF244, partial [Symbiodinium sp. CCMP2456]